MTFKSFSFKILFVDSELAAHWYIKFVNSLLLCGATVDVWPITAKVVQCIVCLRR